MLGIVSQEIDGNFEKTAGWTELEKGIAAEGGDARGDGYRVGRGIAYSGPDGIEWEVRYEEEGETRRVLTLWASPADGRDSPGGI